MSMSIGAGTVTRTSRSTPELRLQPLDQVKQRQWLQSALDQQAGVEKAWLVEDLPHRIGVVDTGAGEDLHALLAQRVDRRLQVGAPITDIGAETEQASPQCRHRAYSAGSRQTSTETSSTGSGIGGSGLAAFTHMPSSS